MLKKRWRRFALALVALVVLVAGILLIASALRDHKEPGGSGEVKGIMYRITDGDTTLYLLGSIHVGNEEMHPFGTDIQSAMEESDIFIFECDAKTSEAVSIINHMMVYQDGTVLADVISEPLYAKLNTVWKQKNFRPLSLDGLKPWAVTNMLSQEAVVAEFGVQSLETAQKYGVDESVRAFADNNKKALRYVETMQEQLAMMDGFSPALQEYLLNEALDLIAEPSMATGMNAELALWPVWWKAGNATAFAESFARSYEHMQDAALLEEYYTALIGRRNSHMAAELDRILKENPGSTCFATIGLLHVVLPDGSIPEHLQSLGYDVTFLE